MSTTAKPDESGLGLEAQEAAIERYRMAGTAGPLLKTYVEVESGTHDDVEDRPQLRAAVAHARRSDAVLTIAKIDRLVRSTVVMAYLKKSRVRFVACDNPYANELTIDILVAVAADEARRISTRTREALAAYKAGRRVSRRVRDCTRAGCRRRSSRRRGGKLGASCPSAATSPPRPGGWGGAAAAAHRRHADEAYADLAGWVAERRRAGMSLRRIAAALNFEGLARKATNAGLARRPPITSRLAATPERRRGQGRLGLLSPGRQSKIRVRRLVRSPEHPATR